MAKADAERKVAIEEAAGEARELKKNKKRLAQLNAKLRRDAKAIHAGGSLSVTVCGSRKS